MTMTGLSIGFYEPPPTDRELNAAIVRAVVREQFPELAVASVEPMGEGWEFETFLIDDRVVFRFPRRADGGDGFEWQERLHILVASVIGDIVRIPRITRWGRPCRRCRREHRGPERCRPGRRASAVASLGERGAGDQGSC